MRLTPYFLALADRRQMHWMAELAVERDTIRSIRGRQTAWTGGCSKGRRQPGPLSTGRRLAFDYTWRAKPRRSNRPADLQQELAALASFAAAQKVRIGGASRSVQCNCIWERYSDGPQLRSRSRKDHRSPKRMGALPLDETRRVSGKDFLTAASGRQLWQHFTGAMGANAI